MNTDRSLFAIACRATALSFLMMGTTALLQAQNAPSIATTSKAPILLASESASETLASASTNAFSSSSSSDANATSDGLATALDSAQPPPRRYGRPNYDSHSNPDGSSRWTGMGGMGLAMPIGDTHVYETPSWGLQFGVGRNYNKEFGVIAQFDYDHFGLQGQTLANYSYLYDTYYYCSPANANAGNCTPVTGILDGNNHVWSFTLNPTFTLPTTGTWGAYAVVGGGFYHKVTNFTIPATGVYYDLYTCPYGCQYQANQNIDHYTSNSFGVNGGFGITYKFSQFARERLYMEVRYVLLLNSQRYGLTVADSTSAPYGTPAAPTSEYTGSNLYPQNSNRTTYIPIKFGIRF